MLMIHRKERSDSTLQAFLSAWELEAAMDFVRHESSILHHVHKMLYAKYGVQGSALNNVTATTPAVVCFLIDPSTLTPPSPPLKHSPRGPFSIKNNT
ncbi:hypothetical protein HID58_007119 [Brassica napus]|uniref:Uncharacterized protein n=1 Tax=Brassica napus TaxID=3708 RepID=A0ABQ8EDC0_BRANA|nr:hypothetical protein HID58_007119 [Brassica napus]